MAFSKCETILVDTDLKSVVLSGLSIKITDKIYLKNGVAINNGTVTEIGKPGEELLLTAKLKYTGFVVVKTSIINGVVHSTIEMSHIKRDMVEKKNDILKYFTIIEFSNGVICEDFRQNYEVDKKMISEINKKIEVDKSKEILNVYKWDMLNTAKRLDECMLEVMNSVLKSGENYFKIDIYHKNTPNIFQAIKLELYSDFKGGYIQGIINSEEMHIDFNLFLENEELSFGFRFKNGIISKQITTNIPYIKLQSKNAINYLRKLADDTSSVRYSFIGDSITSGVDSNSSLVFPIKDDNGHVWAKNVKSTKLTYPHIFAKTMKKFYPEKEIEINNMGIPGQTARKIYNCWWKTDDTDMVFIALGTNDILIDHNEFIEYMSLLIERYLRHGAAVALILPIYSQTKYLRCDIDIMRTVIKNLSLEYGLPVMDFATVSEGMDRNSWSDGTHPSEHGYHILGQSLASFASGSHMFLTNKNRLTTNGYMKVLPEVTTLLGGKIKNSRTTRKLSPIPGYYEENTGHNMVLKSGDSCYIPIHVEEDNLYIIPSIAIIVNNTEVKINMRINGVKKEISCVQANSNAWVSTSKREYTKHYTNSKTEILKEDFSGYGSNIYSLETCIKNAVPATKLISSQGRGWQYLKITNNSNAFAISIFGIQCISERDYYAATGVEAQRQNLLGDSEENSKKKYRILKKGNKILKKGNRMLDKGVL